MVKQEEVINNTSAETNIRLSVRILYTRLIQLLFRFIIRIIWKSNEGYNFDLFKIQVLLSSLMKFLIVSTSSLTGERTEIPRRSTLIYIRLLLVLLINFTFAIDLSGSVTSIHDSGPKFN